MYTYTWKKYLPVIRLLLKKSAAGDQQLNLNRTDFEKTSKVRKPVCSFSIELERGRLSPLNKSAVAKDLLEILMQDDASKTLLRQNHYIISLSSDFLLTIKNSSPVNEEVGISPKDDKSEAITEETAQA